MRYLGYHITGKCYLYRSYSAVRIVKQRRLRMAGHMARMGESKNAYRILIRTVAGDRHLGEPRPFTGGNLLTFQKIFISIGTAMRTSNLTFRCIINICYVRTGIYWSWLTIEL
jgi:hypothetical protein